MPRLSYKKLYQQELDNNEKLTEQYNYYKDAFYDLAKLLGETGMVIINGIKPGNEPFPVDKLVYKMLLYALEMNQRIVGLDSDVMPMANGVQPMTIKGRPIVLKD